MESSSKNGESFWHTTILYSIFLCLTTNEKLMSRETVYEQLLGEGNLYGIYFKIVNIIVCDKKRFIT